MPSSYTQIIPVWAHSQICLFCDRNTLLCVSILQAPCLHNINKTECIESLKGILITVIAKPGVVELHTNFRKAQLEDRRADESWVNSQLDFV